MTASRLPARLPIDVRPRHSESVNSYIDRLARANHLKPADLRAYLCDPPESPRGRPRPERLAAVSGRPVSVLGLTLSGLFCEGCKEPLQDTGKGRPARWCSQRCRQVAWSQRRKEGRAGELTSGLRLRRVR